MWLRSAALLCGCWRSTPDVVRVVKAFIRCLIAGTLSTRSLASVETLAELGRARRSTRIVGSRVCHLPRDDVILLLDCTRTPTGAEGHRLLIPVA